VKTPFVLLFDSDIEMLKSPVQAMLDMTEDDTYGVGYIEKTAFDGHEWGCKPQHLNQGWMRYLHPYFCLIQLKEYKKYNPFIHHGAPAVNTCLDIHRRGLGNKVIKEFPGLGHSAGQGWVWTAAPREFIRHDTAGTRTYRRNRKQEEIEGTWEKVIDPGGITCITCTGDRPLAFSLCQKWMSQQTITPDQWIIIDDGVIKSDAANLKFTDYHRRNPASSDSKHTMVLNLSLALDKIRNPKVLIIEDDEYYAPNYIEEMSRKLNNYEIVGIGRSKYYLINQYKYYRHTNMGHASLAQTGFKTSFLPNVKKCLPGDQFFDLRLWRIVNGSDAERVPCDSQVKERITNSKTGIVFDDCDQMLYVGIKGMPGRGGIGSGHKDSGWYKPDFNKIVLRQWIKNDVDCQTYLDLPSNPVSIVSEHIRASAPTPRQVRSSPIKSTRLSRKPLMGSIRSTNMIRVRPPR
jgi:hypothetical protein